MKWAETRSEHFLTAAGDRDQVHEARIGLERDGAHRRHRDRVHARSRRVAHARRGHHAQHDQSPARAVPRAELPRGRPQRRSPTRPSPPPIAAPAGPRPPSCSTGCSTARRARIGMDPAELRRRNLIRARRDAEPRPGSPTATARRSPTTRPTTRRPSIALLARARLRGLARRAGGAARERRGPSASGSAPTSRAPASAPSRAPTSAWIPTAPCSCTSASARRARATRRRWPRSRPTSSAVPLESRGGGGRRHQPGRLRHGHDREPRGRGGRARGGALRRARSRTRRGWSAPSSSSARPRTSCSPRAACASKGVPGRSVRARPGGARRGAEPRGGGGGRPGAQRLRLLLSRHGHVGLRRAGRRRRGGPRGLRDHAAQAGRHARLRAARSTR